MADTDRKTSAAASNEEVESYADNLTEKMCDWKEIIVLLDDFLHWKKPFYPLILIGWMSFSFLCTWYMDFSVLTLLSLIMFKLSMMDYLVPAILSKYLSVIEWNDARVEQFKHVCTRFSEMKFSTCERCCALKAMRVEKPRQFFFMSVVVLLCLAWIGNTVHNLLLAYICLSFMLLSPGIKHHGILGKYYKIVMTKIKEVLGLHKKKD